MSELSAMSKLNKALEILKAEKGDITVAYVVLAGYLMALANDKQADTVLNLVEKANN